jgi:mannose-6-phosphate isomerase
MTWYPLKLSYATRSYSFGERLIADKLGKRDLPEGRVAETWEISDYREARATVRNGAFAGKLLHELVEAYPDELVGQGWRGPHFPLLGKFLDASHRLPVHLHADDATARRKHNEPNGKSEAWHILWAAPGATILAGIKPGFDHAALFEAFKAQDYDRVMYRYGIQAGDTVYVPGGILHAFGPDTLIFEIQQTSDLGQTVMPEDLYGNKLTEAEWDDNIRETLDELRADFLPKPHPGLMLQSQNNQRMIGCASAHFALERWRLSGAYTEPSHPQRCMTLSNLGGPVTLIYAGGAEKLKTAQSCILPAAIGEVTIIPESSGELIACYLPDLQRDIITPLQAAGYSLSDIRQLGELA